MKVDVGSCGRIGFNDWKTNIYIYIPTPQRTSPLSVKRGMRINDCLLFDDCGKHHWGLKTMYIRNQTFLQRLILVLSYDLLE